MADPCLGCGTTTDANGDLTILGARSAAWKVDAYGPIGEVNGLRCDPVTRELWTPPPYKAGTAVLTPGSYISQIKGSLIHNTQYAIVGDGSVTPPNSGTITANLSDSQNYANKRMVASGTNYTFNNPTPQPVDLHLTLQALLGAQSVYAGLVNSTFFGAAGLQTTVAINGGAPIERVIEFIFSGGNSLDSDLTRVMAYHGSSADCARTEVFEIPANGSCVINTNVYFRSDFGNERMMVFSWGQPQVLATFSTRRPFSSNLDD